MRPDTDSGRHYLDDSGVLDLDDERAYLGYAERLHELACGAFLGDPDYDGVRAYRQRTAELLSDLG